MPGWCGGCWRRSSGPGLAAGQRGPLGPDGEHHLPVGALCARLPRLARWASNLEAELRWLPELAPHLPLPVPEPVAAGRAGQGYPFRWALIRWMSGGPSRRPDR